MKIKTFETAAQARREALLRVLDQVTAGANWLLSAAASDLALYQALADSTADLSAVSLFSDAEWLGKSGLAPDSLQAAFTETGLAERFRHTFWLDGNNPDGAAEVAHYEALLKGHPLDLAVFTLAADGSLGLNAPGTPFNSHTRRIDTPQAAYTIGLDTVSQAKHVLVLAFGAERAQAVRQTAIERADESVPASVLQTHTHALLLLDRAAASQL